MSKTLSWPGVGRKETFLVKRKVTFPFREMWKSRKVFFEIHREKWKCRKVILLGAKSGKVTFLHFAKSGKVTFLDFAKGNFSLFRER